MRTITILLVIIAILLVYLAWKTRDGKGITFVLGKKYIIVPAGSQQAPTQQQSPNQAEKSGTFYGEGNMTSNYIQGMEYGRKVLTGIMGASTPGIS